MLTAATSLRPALAEPSAPHRHTGILAVILLGYFMVILDNSIVITGLPQISEDLSMAPSELAWVQNAYMLTFGGLLLLGARAGDIFGRRRMFVAGLVIFTLASVSVGLAPSAETLIAARAAQGLGSAILAPSTLALLTAVFPEGPDRIRATAAYGAVAGIGASVGLVAGGLLTDLLSWRVAFLINLPIGIGLLIAGLRVLPETPRTRGSFDIAGSLLATLGPAALAYGFVSASEIGWLAPVTLGALAAGAALLVSLVLVERTAKLPIMPLGLFASRERTGAYLARLLFIGAMMAFFLLTSQFLQDQRGYSALTAGIAFFPMTVVNFIVALGIPRLQRRFTGPTLLVAGLIFAVSGMAWLATSESSTSYVFGIALPMALIGAGQGLAFAPLTSSGIAGVIPAQAGAASGVVNSFHQLGGALGLSLVLAVSSSYGSAMLAGSFLLGGALIIALTLVVPGSRSRSRSRHPLPTPSHH